MSVFTHSAIDPRTTACVNYWNDSLHATCASYLRSAQLHLRHVLDTGRDLDMLALPILFSWRHYLELRFKLLCVDAAIVQDEAMTIDGTHDLKILWKKARARLVELFPREDHARELAAVDAHIPELARIDPRSMTFRYTVGKNWERLLPLQVTHVAYAELAQLVAETSSILEAASCMTAQAVDYVTAARAEAEREDDCHR